MDFQTVWFRPFTSLLLSAIWWYFSWATARNGCFSIANALCSWKNAQQRHVCVAGFALICFESGRSLVARIARPASLAISRRYGVIAGAHCRPNRSESPNRKHFASLDVHARWNFALQANIARFWQELCGILPVISEQAKGFSRR